MIPLLIVADCVSALGIIVWTAVWWTERVEAKKQAERNSGKTGRDKQPQEGGGRSPWPKVPEDQPAPDPDPKKIEKVILADPENPSTTPKPNSYYWVQQGDVGVRIVSRTYDIPQTGGQCVRAWKKVCQHKDNDALAKTAGARWDGLLLPQHMAPGQHRRGTGKKLPVIKLPPKAEVVD